MTTVSRPHIVVGIEGTNASEAALQWAVREAGLRGCPLTVVHAWSFDPVRDAGRTNEHAERRASVCMIGAEIATAIRKVGVSPEVIERSVHGSPARTLVKEADRKAGAEAGADAYITKPPDAAALVEAIQRFLG